MRPGTSHAVEKAKTERQESIASKRKAILGKDPSMEYKKSEQERLITHSVLLNPKEILDRLSTRQILDYLKLYRNMKI